MPTEIGPALHEARMRQKIDVNAVEQQTKIRAKYLRALENEEWDLLPGPAYVRSFLRTYANYLSLDGDVLVDEYRRQHETPETGAYPLVEPMLREPRRARRPELPIPRVPELSRGAVAALAAAAIIGVLFVVGLIAGSGDDGPSGSLAGRPAETGPRRAAEPARQAGPPANAEPSRVEVRLSPQAPVWVCLVGPTGRGVVNGEILNRGDDKGPYSAKRFDLSLGNGSMTVRVNGKDFDVPESSDPLGFEITPDRVHALKPDARPTCA
jgi:hypothetical protein